MKSKKGFTLIELLVVVLIIGILAAIAVPQYQKAVWKTRYNTIKLMVKNLVQAEEDFYLSNGRYTNNFKELNIELPGAEACTTGTCVFSGGICYLEKGNYNAAICYVYKAENPYMAYIERFTNSLDPNTRICRAYSQDENALDSKICKEETGKSQMHPNSGFFFSMY